RRAHAEIRSQKVNFFVGKSLLQAVDEIYFGADRPFRSGRGIFDGLDDVRCRAVKIAFLNDLADAFRMDKNFDVGNLLADLIDMPRFKSAVHGTMSSPKN